MTTTIRTNWYDTLQARRRGEDPDFTGTQPLEGTGDEPAESWDEFRARAKALGVAITGNRAAIQARIDALEAD